MKTYLIIVAAILTVMTVCCGAGFTGFILWSNSVQWQCAEAGRRQGVVATYNVHNGCTTRGVFGVRVPVDMDV